MAPSEQTISVRIPRAAVGLESYLKERGISYRKFGRELGVSGAAVYNWCKKGQPPSAEMQEKIELFAAKVNPATGRPVRDPDTDHWVSHIPREWWALDGQPPPAKVEPYETRVARGEG